MSPLLRELRTACRTARLPDLATALQACGLPIDTGPTWGVSFVEIDTHNFTPAAGGKPAIIVPLFEDGALLDLIAVGLSTRSTRTRAGIATVLGQEWIDHAKATEATVRLFADPIEWLRNGRRGSVIVDWRSARFALSDVPGIACENELLAERIKRAMQQPVHLPKLFVREPHRAAA
jgi:hypothetical protein